MVVQYTGWNRDGYEVEVWWYSKLDGIEVVMKWAAVEVHYTGRNRHASPDKFIGFLAR